MTDEEARRVVRQTLQVDDDYGDMSVEMMLVKAGYRAGLEEARTLLKKSDGDIDFLLFQLDAKLKE